MAKGPIVWSRFLQETKERKLPIRQELDKMASTRNPTKKCHSNKAALTTGASFLAPLLFIMFHLVISASGAEKGKKI